MSLQVWLPLNGTLNNQGLSPIGVTNNGATTTTGGKFGQCYQFNGTSNYLNITDYTFSGLQAFSIAFWCCSTSATLQPIFQIKSGTSVAFQFSAADTFNFRDSKHANLTNVTFTPPVAGVWTHYIFIYQAGNWLIYKDGIKDGNGFSATQSATFYPGSTTFYICRRNITSGNTYYDGKINDFRVYDHALSLKEIEELSKGLALHYKLDSNIAIGTIQSKLQYDKNIYTEPDGSQWVHVFHHNNPAGGLFASTDSFTTSVYKDENRWLDMALVMSSVTSWELLYVQKDTSTSAEKKYRWIQNINPFNATWTDVQPGNVTYVTGNGYTSSTQGGLWKNNGSTYFAIANASSGNWFGAIGSWTAYSGGTPGYPNTTVTSGSMDLYVRLKNINILDIYDMSGFNNHGVLVNTLVPTTDTPRYTNAMNFNNTQYIRANKQPANMFPTDTITVNMWIKPTIWGRNPLSCTQNGGFNFEQNSTASKGIQFPIYIATSSNYAGAYSNVTIASLLNNWHMITGVYNGTNTIIYIDGVEKGRDNIRALAGTIGYAANAFFIAAEAAGNTTTPEDTAYQGNISDVRIYSTALSAAAIKELYNTSGAIDNNGNIYTREVIE